MCIRDAHAVDLARLARIGRLGNDGAIGDGGNRRVGLSLAWAPGWRGHRATMTGVH